MGVGVGPWLTNLAKQLCLRTWMESVPYIDMKLYLTGKWLIVPNLCVHTSTTLSRHVELWYLLGWGCLCYQHPPKHLALSLMSFPGRQHLTHIITSNGEIKHILSVWFYQEKVLEACTQLTLDFIPGSFSWFYSVSFHCKPCAKFK